jgi:ABC-2 type transport system permease protein
MKLLIETVKIHLKVFFQYKAAFAITLLIRPIAFLINIALFSCIYKYNNTDIIKGYAFNQMVWYFGVVTLINQFTWGFTHFIMSEKILSGELTINLVKPISVFKFELGNAMALRITGITCEFIPCMVIYSIFCYPSFLTVVSFLQFLSFCVGSFMLYYLIRFVFGLLAFFFKKTGSLNVFLMFFIEFLGGGLIPIEFFPKWLLTIINYLPFKYMFYWPIQFFLQTDAAKQDFQYIKILLTQCMWIAVFLIIVKLAWSKAVKHYCGVGV